MTVQPSRSQFAPDALSALVPFASPITTVEDGDFSGGISIDQLSAYWNSAGDIAIPQEFRFVFYLGRQAGHYGETYTFTVVTDTVDDFSNTPATIATATVAKDEAGVLEYVLAREQFAGTSDSFVGLEFAMTDGYPVGYIAFDDAATAGDEVDVDDAAFKTRDVVISGTLTANDTISIDDGPHSPLVFTAKASGAVIASHEFNIGASASQSAQNFKAAVDFAITAGTLVDVTTSGASTTITIKYRTAGTVVEGTDAGNKIAVSSAAAVADALVFGTYDVGSLVYSGVMTDGDGVTIDDGVHDPVTFTFKNSPDMFDPTEVAVGSTATTSSQNLKLVIENAVQLGYLSVTVSGGTTTLTITNTATVDGLVSTTGAITETTDSGSKQAVTDFTGVSPGVATGTTAAESASNLKTAIDADTYTNTNMTAFELNATTVGIVNYGATVGVNSGSLAEDTDDGGIITVTDFAVPTAQLNMWAYAASCYS